MIATYNEDGSVNVMNAAWGTMVERVMADGKVDISRVDAIAFDPYTHGYYRVTERVGEAFKDGLKLKKITEQAVLFDKLKRCRTEFCTAFLLDRLRQLLCRDNCPHIPEKTDGLLMIGFRIAGTLPGPRWRASSCRTGTATSPTASSAWANTITIRAALGKGQNSPGLHREIRNMPR